MIKILAVVVILFIAGTVSSFSQTKWSVDKDYLMLDNELLFLNGVNYVPPINWMMMLEYWDEVQAEKDIVGMKSIGVKCIRFFPLWNLLQPTPNQLDEKILKRIDQMLDLGAKHGLYFQITPITGWMSGGTFLPDWAMGNIFMDTEIINGEKLMVRELAKRYKNHPALQGFDFGNEINVLIDQMKLDLTPEDIDKWMQTIYAAFKEGDSECIVTNGIGTGFDPYFNIEAISKSCDYMSLHSYPFFHGTSRLDPTIGQRTLYSGNFITEWVAMVHKPVLVQENGTARPGLESAKGLRIYHISSWAEGAAGYFWWGSHMVDPEYTITSPGLRPEYSLNNMKRGELGPDKRMGLLSVENTPEVTGSQYKECTEWIDKLGGGWVDQLPVCYIIVPHTTEFYNTMLKFITPFVLAKQAHFDVKLLWEDQKVPDDASVVVVPNILLSQKGKEMVGRYLENGGVVFQSFYNDFSSDIRLSGEPLEQVDSLLLGFFETTFGKTVNMPLRVKNVKVCDFSSDTSKVISLIQSKIQTEDKEIFVRTKVGEGDFYYLALNAEEALEKVRDPWQNDDSYLFYLSLMPKTDFQIDNKYVEFYHKKRGNEELLVLLNHDNEVQITSLLSNRSVKLENAITGEKLGNSRDFSVELEPAGIIFINVK